MKIIVAIFVLGGALLGALTGFAIGGSIVYHLLKWLGLITE